MFMHRAREIGRLSRFAKKYRDYDDRNVFNHKCQRMLVLVGRVIFLLRINSKMKIVLALAKKQDLAGEYQKDKNEQKMFELFAEGTIVLEPYIRKTPALRDAFAMRLTTRS